MKRKIIAIMAMAVMLIGSAAPVLADPGCNGALNDRPSSCFNAGPGQPGFHGP